MASVIRGVVFDLDNTLINFQKGSRQALRTASRMIAKHLKKRGYNYTETLLLRKLRPIDREMQHRKLYNRDVWWKILLRNLGLAKLQGPWIHRTTLRYWEACTKASLPYRDAEPTLRRLRNEDFRLAIVSDSDGIPNMKTKRIGLLPFRSLFEAIVVAGEDTPKVKPSKAPFLLIAKRLKLRPESCVYIGDNPTTDIEGARAAGMSTILVRRGGVRDGHSTRTIKSLRELVRILHASRAIRR